MPTVYIDDKPYEVDEGQNMLQAAQSLGIDLPYFCWHPALGSVGACRQCAVIQYKDENDKKGKLAMACMLDASDGTRISVKARQAEEFRASVIEWLMVNHPHDCPVCDEGGECHLQDMTVMTGHNYREFRFNKRTHRNQYLGPFINHEMNRCIACYRCVRFYREYAGGDDLNVFGPHDHVFFGRQEEGVLESEFAGNLVEVCPTGVFTDKTLKQHYARKWDLQSGPSVCNHCGVGCNTLVAERYDKVVRVLNRYNGEVNGYFICDRGRFGYEFINGPDRISKPRSKNNGSSDEPVDIAAEVATFIKSGRAIGIGSPRASLESNFALKTLVGRENFYSGLSEADNTLIAETLNILRDGPARTPSLRDIEEADAVLVLGEDLTNTAPMMALAVRQSVVNKPAEKAGKIGVPDWNDAAVREIMQEDTGPLFVATPSGTKLDSLADETYRAAPDDIARFGFAIAHAISNDAPQVSGLDEKTAELAKHVAGILKNADKPVIISGTSLHSVAVLHASANVAGALISGGKKAGLALTVPECNSMATGLLEGASLESAVEAASSNDIETVVVLENDLYRRAPEELVEKLFSACKNVIVIDHSKTRTTAQATVILPAATYGEGDGTLVSSEGRAQRFFQALPPKHDKVESWLWIKEIMKQAGRSEVEAWKSVDHVCDKAFEDMPGFERAPEVAPDPDFRINDQLIPRSPHRFSGRTSIHANISVVEPKPPYDPDSPLSFSMEGYSGRPPSSLIPFFWAPGWNSVQATAKYQSEVGGALKGGDPGIRLFEPRDDAEVSFSGKIPDAFQKHTDEWLAVPIFLIFGSEEQSARAKHLSELVPQPYVVISEADAKRLDVKSGDSVSFNSDSGKGTFSIRISDSLPAGVVGCTVGLPDQPMIVLPTWTRLARVGK